MSDYESVNKIKSLQQHIETFTGKSYSDLTSAVQELKNGYGSSSIIEVSELPTENIDENAVYKVSGDEINWYIRENGEWKKISPDVQTKEIAYIENGDYEILPDDGKQLSKATVKVAVPERYDEGYETGKIDGYSEGYTASQNARQEKSITQNGEYTPDEGYSGFSKVTVNVTDVDTVDGWHVAVRDDGTAPPSGTINTITFVYGG